MKDALRRIQFGGFKAVLGKIKLTYRMLTLRILIVYFLTVLFSKAIKCKPKLAADSLSRVLHLITALLGIQHRGEFFYFIVLLSKQALLIHIGDASRGCRSIMSCLCAADFDPDIKLLEMQGCMYVGTYFKQQQPVNAVAIEFSSGMFFSLFLVCVDLQNCYFFRIFFKSRWLCCVLFLKAAGRQGNTQSTLHLQIDMQKCLGSIEPRKCVVALSKW